MPVQRGEVYFIELSPTRGREQSGRRPVVVVSNDEINSRPLVVLVVPGSRGSKHARDYPGQIRVAAGEANLREETVFLTIQARAVDPGRFDSPAIGSLSEGAMKQIEDGLAWSFGIETV
jgi:mRNA interferase MazF